MNAIAHTTPEWSIPRIDAAPGWLPRGHGRRRSVAAEKWCGAEVHPLIPDAMSTTGPRADLRRPCLRACAAQRTKDAALRSKLPKSNHPPPHRRSPLRDTDRQTRRRRSPRRKNPFPHFPESTHEPRPGHRRGAKPHFCFFPKSTL